MKKPKTNHTVRRALAVLLLVGCGEMMVCAAEPDTGTQRKKHAHTEKVKDRLHSSSDETVSTTQIKLENAYAAQTKDAWKNTTTLNGTYAFGGKRKNDWAVKLGLPYVYVDPGTSKKKTQESGLGDITLKLTRSFRFSPQFRLAPSLEAEFNTAVDDELGDGSTVLIPAVASSYRVSQLFSALLTVSYRGSIEEDPGVDETSTLILKPGVSLSLPHYWHGAAYYIGRVNYTTDAYTDSAKVQLSKLLGSERKWNVGANLTVPLESGVTEWTAGLNLTYHL